MSDATGTTAAAGLALGEHTDAFEAAVARARDERWAERLVERDPSLWSSDARVQAAISERLGWLDSPAHFSDQIAALEGFGEGIRDAGFTTAVVAGMGGSSLAPEVLARTFGTADGWLELRVLDSTDPAAVAAVVDDLDPLATLFIVASKSGTTTEPLAFQADAWARIEAALRSRNAPRNEHAGELMIAITDPGTSVEAIPHHDELREVFLNPPDIGGRYAALSYVGLVPASLIGLDLDALLASAVAMAGACREPEPTANPGVSLGLAMGALARAGRDKLTFLADPEIITFGAWLEQLIAESTGKRGVGIVPVDREPLGEASAYGRDRVIVRLRLGGATGADVDAADRLTAELEAAGHPIIRIDIADPIDLGAEAYRWEVATAISGAVLGIDPFDQPNVEEAKNRTRDLLARHDDEPNRRATDADAGSPLASDGGLALHGDAPLRLSADGERTLVGELRRHLERRRPNAYLAIQGFIAPSPSRDKAIARIRTLLRSGTGCATTAGYGPRFLHSTGQLHKGGAPIGWFLQLTSNHPVDRPIPGWPYSFGHLIDAQAQGDFEAIESHDLPIIRVHLADPESGLAALEAALAAALEAPIGAG
jgi:transaldolase/glucose-6-phosphate isomerase